MPQYRILSNDPRNPRRLFRPLRASRRHRLSSEDLLSNTKSTAPTPGVELPPKSRLHYVTLVRRNLLGLNEYETLNANFIESTRT